MRSKFVMVLAALALAVLLPASALAGKPPKTGNADPRVAFLSNPQKISVANADGSNVTTIVSTKWGRLHRPLMFPNRRAILYHYEYPSLARSLRVTEFSVTNGAIAVGATTDLGDLAAYAIAPDGSRIAFFDPAFPPPNMKIQEMDLATGAVWPIFDLPSGHDLHLFGGYTFDASALVLIVYDENSIYDYDSIMVIDLDSSGVGVSAREVLDLAGWGNKLMDLEPANTSRKVLFDAMNVMYVLDLDALDIGPVRVGDGHMGTWAPDDSTVLYIDMPQNNTWTFGPAFKIDLAAGEISEFTGPKTYISDPSWR